MFFSFCNLITTAEQQIDMFFLSSSRALGDFPHCSNPLKVRLNVHQVKKKLATWVVCVSLVMHFAGPNKSHFDKSAKL